MRLRHCDRYLLQEMVGPFVLALVGLLIFLLLNIVLSLTPLMVDRGIGMGTLLRLVVFELPKLFVLAVPMAALFATFLGLGRLLHDREIMALESIGISLRRLLFPLIVAAAALGVLDFAINNWAAPASERAFQRTYLEVVFRQSVPRITPNAFFSGPDHLTFYVRRYDADRRTLNDVLIYDTQGELFPAMSEAEVQIALITAETGTWSEATWELDDGRTYGFDGEGKLLTSGTFDRLTIPVDRSVEEVLSRSRSPDEMGISELLARVRQAEDTGQRTEPYVLEIHHKIALPLSTIVFVLLGGTLSFTFGTRGRAVGIIVSLLLISVFTGLLWWTQALGQRGAMHPVLAAWLPNLLFGAFGALMFLRVDRLASRDLLRRVRRFVPFLSTIALTSFLAVAEGLPLEIEAERLSISSDRSEIQAEGHVSASFEYVVLSAQALDLHRASDGRWNLQAIGDVHLATEEGLTIRGDQLVAVVEPTETGARTSTLEATGFHGESPFINVAGDEHVLYFRGASARITFDEEGEASLIEVDRGEVTTCGCCGRSFRGQPYTLRASRFTLHPDRLLVAYGLVARVGGVPSFWLPVYVQPLEETLDNPLFPAIGRSGLRGWFLKWNVPFFLTDGLYGSVLFDYYHRFRELGTGIDVRYAFGNHTGAVDVYYFPAKAGDRIVRLSANHAFEVDKTWRGSGRLDYDAVGDESSLSFSADVSVRLGGWRVTASGTRSWEEDSDEEGRVTQRLPELSLTREAGHIGSLSLIPRASAAWVWEWNEGTLTGQALRLAASASVGVEPFTVAGCSIAPTLDASATRYAGGEVERTRAALSVAVPCTYRGLSVDYDGSWITGTSPFDYDRLDAEQHIGWAIEQAGAVRARLDGGIDLFAGQFDPVSVGVSWGDAWSWSLSLSYDLAAAAVSSLVVRGAWTQERYTLAWKLPLDPTDAHWGPLDLDLSTAWNNTEVTVEASLDRGRPTSLSATLDTRFSAPWGVAVEFGYRIDRTPRLQAPHYRLYRDVGDCVQVGIERSSDQVWLYASILAFPEAILRYGPESAQVSVGE